MDGERRENTEALPLEYHDRGQGPRTGAKGKYLPRRRRRRRVKRKCRGPSAQPPYKELNK